MSITPRSAALAAAATTLALAVTTMPATSRALAPVPPVAPGVAGQPIPRVAPSAPAAALPAPRPAPDRDPAPAPVPRTPPVPAPAPAPEELVVWRVSRAEGTPQDGRLVDGVQLPAQGPHHLTWDPVADVSPAPEHRRWGTDRLVRVALEVLADYAAAHPEAPQVVVGDLSHPQGGEMGGHASHENGLDMDVYYPRRDGQATVPASAAEVDLALAQDLVDRFVAAGAQYVFVGPNTPLTGPSPVVQPLRLHDNHLHVRLAAG